MNVRELSRSQLIELKCNYLSELVNNGKFAEVMGVDYNEPSYCDIANVNELVTDEFIYNYYEDYTFTDDDFFCSCAA